MQVALSNMHTIGLFTELGDGYAVRGELVVMSTNAPIVLRQEIILFAMVVS